MEPQTSDSPRPYLKRRASRIRAGTPAYDTLPKGAKKNVDFPR